MPNDGGKLLELLKMITHQTMQAADLADVVVGDVTSEEPLVITLEENKLQIPADNISLTKNTCLWSVDMTVAHHTDNAAGGSGEAQYESHNHGYSGTKTYLVHNELHVGDKVWLLRESGGQRFLAIDRIYNPNRGCAG